MESIVIKRKILLEDSIDRTANSPTWGQLTATTFYININLNQTIDDMGLFTDIEYIPKGDLSGTPADYTILLNKLTISGLTFPFMSGATVMSLSGLSETDILSLRLPSSGVTDYYNFGNGLISGATDSKIEDLRSYDGQNPFKVGFNMGAESYINYSGGSVNGVSRVKSIGEPTVYVFDTENDVNLGTINQKYGLNYSDYSATTRDVTIDGQINTIPLTTVGYVGEGWNDTNVSLSALTKEEYLFGITNKPDVQSDVFIDRGATTVLDLHLRMSEIKNLGQLARYGNGFYKLNKQ